MLKHLLKNKIVNTIVLILLDIIAVCLSSLMGLLFRFDFVYSEIPDIYLESAWAFLPVYAFITVVIFAILNLYKYMWSAASIREAGMIVFACVVVTALQLTGMILFDLKIHRSFFVVCFIVQTIEVTLTRFSARIFNLAVTTPIRMPKDAPKIIIVGAGEAGVSILKEIKQSALTEGNVVCMVDDDPDKQGKIVNGVKVEGGREDIPKLVEKYDADRIYISMPAASAKERRAILKLCVETGVKEVKNLPGIYQMINSNNISVASLNKVSIKDLLERDPIETDLTEVFNHLEGKTILVTGGGGSIGSELCRQIIQHNPKLLVVVDIYENGIYDLQQELKLSVPNKNIVYLIGSVRNTHRMDTIFNKYRPDIVFHAAAHKHVPLMEDAPCESLKNNSIATYKCACCAEKYDVDTFVLISTDKAVNPTNIMGASKRICEMIIQSKAARQREVKEHPELATDTCHGKTKFVAVRFGNVLGSNGSVIPLFEKQIEAGGPVTVTHPEVIRYFMTIPEAVSLVLEASVYAKGGEIFVLDMGEPVKILDLARNMIRLSGLEPGKDIDIKFTGLRPGEKLYEELLMDEEGLQSTPNKLIKIGKPINFDTEVFYEKFERLTEAAKLDADNIRDIVKEIVPTYHKPDEVDNGIPEDTPHVSTGNTDILAEGDDSELEE